MMNRISLGFFCICALTLAASKQETGFDPDRLARIPARMQTFIDRGEVAGIVTLIARHGQIAQVHATGFQDLEGRKPMRADSIFQIMSMTKPFTAVGIMMLAEEGKLAIGDPVEKYLPEFRGQMMIESRTGEKLKLRKPARPITIRDLMTHTSGLPQVPPVPADLYTKMDRTLAEAVSLFSQEHLDFEPGTRWQYSNPGIATLGRIIEVVGGQPYEQFIAARILLPLGMKDTFFFPPADKISRIAFVYTTENGKLVRSDGSILGGDSTQFRKGAKYPAPEFAMYSTAADLAAFYQMMLNGGSYNGKHLLSRESTRVMTDVHTGNIPNSAWSPGAAYGLAWEVVKEPLGALTLESIGSYGHGGAFGTHGWIDPDKDLVGVFLVQHSGSGGIAARNAFMQMAAAAVE
jgi:CubicO group peptidase (beta-lactamase class C family)